MYKKLTIPWLLLGLGSQLQMLNSLSISEFLVIVVAPFLIFTEIMHMRKNGVIIFFTMSILLLLGCIVSQMANHAQFYQVIRALSSTGIMVCSVIVGHHLLRKDPGGLKWYFIGVMLSGFACIFVFQRTVEVAMAGGTDADLIMSGPLFWIQRLGSVLTTPNLAFYLKMPLIYSAGAPLFLAAFSILTSVSGRAAALSFIGTAAVVLIGRKKRKLMMAMGRHFGRLFCAAVIGVFVIKAAYQWAALNNYLGEKARNKFEQQTAGGTGIVKLLIGGRADAFVGLLAIADSPIVGKGYWAADTEGYYEEFLSRYGTQEDYEHYLKYKFSYSQNLRMIACHSHITAFWLWFGLPGLLFWVYVVYVVFRYLREDAWAIPQWFYWLAASVPGFMWHLFFSPFNSRIGLPLWVLGMLMARAVRMGWYTLPHGMIREIEASEMR